MINLSLNLIYLVLTFSPGAKPDITNHGTIVKISIYGNGMVVAGLLFRIHHVFIVLQTEHDIFILLEVDRCANGKIHIHMRTAKSLSDVIKTRLNMKVVESLWRSGNVYISPLLVQKLIDEYHDNHYHPTKKSCRTFVDDISKACNSDIRCVTRDEWWALW